MRWDRGFLFHGRLFPLNHLQLVVISLQISFRLFVTCRVFFESFFNVNHMWFKKNMGIVAWEALTCCADHRPGLFSALDWGTIGGASSRTRTTGAGEAAKQTQVKSLVGRPGGKLHDMRVEWNDWSMSKKQCKVRANGHQIHMLKGAKRGSRAIICLLSLWVLGRSFAASWRIWFRLSPRGNYPPGIIWTKAFSRW